MAGSKKQSSSGKPYDHASEIARVRKVIGQLDGVEKMIVNKRYPPQVIQQVKAASAALSVLRYEILKRHLHEALTEATHSGNYAKFLEQMLETIKMQSVR